MVFLKCPLKGNSHAIFPSEEGTLKAHPYYKPDSIHIGGNAIGTRFNTLRSRPHHCTYNAIAACSAGGCATHSHDFRKLSACAYTYILVRSTCGYRCEIESTMVSSTFPFCIGVGVSGRPLRHGGNDLRMTYDVASLTSCV